MKYLIWSNQNFLEEVHRLFSYPFPSQILIYQRYIQDVLNALIASGQVFLAAARSARGGSDSGVPVCTCPARQWRRVRRGGRPTWIGRLSVPRGANGGRRRPRLCGNQPVSLVTSRRWRGAPEI